MQAEPGVVSAHTRRSATGPWAHLALWHWQGTGGDGEPWQTSPLPSCCGSVLAPLSRRSLPCLHQQASWATGGHGLGLWPLWWALGSLASRQTC